MTTRARVTVTPVPEPKSLRKRVSIPTDEHLALQWWDAQKCPSHSIRMLIHDEVIKHGILERFSLERASRTTPAAGQVSHLPQTQDRPVQPFTTKEVFDIEIDDLAARVQPVADFITAQHDTGFHPVSTSAPAGSAGAPTSEDIPSADLDHPKMLREMLELKAEVLRLRLEHAALVEEIEPARKIVALFNSVSAPADASTLA